MVLGTIVVFVVSIVLLIVAGSYLVKYLTKISNYLHISEFVVSFIIIAFSTSIPELLVGVTSALEGNPELSLGNIIGANIANLTIVIGIPILLSRGIQVRTRAAQYDVYYMFVISALPLVLMSIGNELSRLDGVILLVVFVLYVYKLIQQQREYHKVLPERLSHLEVIKDMVLLIICLVVLTISARYVVFAAGHLADLLSLPPILFGMLFLAIGTSLPELTFNIRSVVLKHPEMALGDTIGSVVANSTLILGVVALIHPITASSLLIYLTSWFFMLLVGFIFLTFVEGNYELTWREGVALVMLYSFFIIIEFYVKTIG